jgi:hypothetical protein
MLSTIKAALNSLFSKNESDSTSLSPKEDPFDAISKARKSITSHFDKLGSNFVPEPPVSVEPLALPVKKPRAPRAKPSTAPVKKTTASPAKKTTAKPVKKTPAPPAQKTTAKPVKKTPAPPVKKATAAKKPSAS